MNRRQIILKLKDIVGQEYVLTDKNDLIPYSRDYSISRIYKEIRGISHALPKICAVQPRKPKEIINIFKIASEHNLKIGVYGGGSNVVGAYNPDIDIVIDISRFKDIKLDRESNIVYAGSGAYIIEVEEFLNKHGFTLGQFPQSIHVTTIGGAVSTGNTGMYSSGYGGIEKILVGLEFVAPRFGYIKYGPHVRRNSLSPLDLMMLNSEGKLGIITGAYFKIFTLPQIRIRRVVKIDSEEEGIENLKKLVKYRVEPDLIRLFDRYESSLHFGVDSPVVIYELHGYKETLDLIYDRDKAILKILDGIELDKELFDKWMENRYGYIHHIYRLYKMGILIETMEFGVSWSKASEFIRDFKEELLSLSSIIYLSYHISHIHRVGCGVYFTLGIDLDGFEKEYSLIWEKALETAIKHGCDISHHHGTGEIRFKYLRYKYGDTVIKIIQSLKELFDPHNILK